MFPKGSRLPPEVFGTKPARRVRFEYGNISFFGTTPVQVSVIVSKKIARRAVDRNRIRRRVLHALRRVPPTTSIVVYPTKEVLKAPFAELIGAFVKTLQAR